MAWARLNEPAGTAYSLPTRLFPADNWWNLSIASAPLDAASDQYISFYSPDNALNFNVSVDFGDNYGIPYITVSGDYPKTFFTNVYYGATSDLGIGYPIPTEAFTVPGWTQDLANTIDTPYAGNDRHMCIVDIDNQYLYEVYNPIRNATGAPVVDAYGFTLQPGEITVGSCRRFDLTSNDNSKRGSTTAAGTAILPGSFLYDEVMGANPITHAINITLNYSTRYAPYYVWPATDYAPGSAVSPVPGENGIGHPPFGARFRLKSSYTPLYNDPYANKLVTCLKTYGCIFMDNATPNGNIQGSNDARWGNFEAYPRNYINYELTNIKATDFEIVELGYNPLVATPSRVRLASLSFSVPDVPYQYARPYDDISAGTWTPTSGGALAPMLDEVTASDSDLIVSTGSGSETATVRLRGANRPVPGGTSRLRIRTKRG